MKHAFVLLLTALLAAAAAGQDGPAGKKGPKPASPADTSEASQADQLKFRQQRALGNMRKLEDRMLKLGELLRESKPDDSARLLLGVQKAREDLILEQMQEIGGLLAKQKLTTATKEQEQVLIKLRELKELLLNADIDLTLKLAQLRQIRQAREALAQLIEKEQAQHQQTSAEPADTKPLAENERRNQRQGENLAEQIRTKIASGQKASQCVGEACKSMGNAAQCLGSKNCSGACQSQQQAVDKLREADQQLEQLQKKLQQEAEASARQRVTDLLMQMIKQQAKVREATERVVKASQEGGELNVSQAALLRRLSDSQQEIALLASEAIEICDLTEFSFALPEALREIREEMGAVTTRLQKPAADRPLIAKQQWIEDELTALLEAMKTASKPSQLTNSQCKGGCCSNKNKLLAEVRMLYRMQQSVSRKTRDLRQRELRGEAAGKQLHDESQSLEKRQDKLREISDRLRKLTTPDYVRGET